MKNNCLAKTNIVKNSPFNIIFIHGWGSNYKSLLYLASLWENKISTHLLYLKGFEIELDREYFLKDYLKDVEDYIKINSLSNIILIGHSFGGKIAIFLKKIHPEYKIIAIAPSLIKNPFNLITYLKIKTYKILKKLHIPLYKLFLGSKDYRHSKSYLRKTFLNIFHHYMEIDEIKKLSPILLIGFKKDKEVKISSLRKVSSSNKKIIYKEYEGDHFSYFDFRYEIYCLIKTCLKDNSI